MLYVFSLGGYGVTSTAETFSNCICVVSLGFVVHFRRGRWRELKYECGSG